ncbi:MAG: JAB domain-containing protein, partial [Deefgea sp.]
EASPADLLLTRQLQHALELLDIKLLDHFIVAGHAVVSLAELGHL